MTGFDSAPLPEQASYTRVAIALHWAIAALLVFEVALGLNMEQARGSAKFAVFQLHKSVGITILLLVLLRIAWRVHRRPPPLNAAGWERALVLASCLSQHPSRTIFCRESRDCEASLRTWLPTAV